MMTTSNNCLPAILDIILTQLQLRFNDKTKKLAIFGILIPTVSEGIFAQEEEANKAFSNL